MNGTVIFGVIALFFILSGLMNFINGLHDEVDTRSSYPTNKKSTSEDYYAINVVGEKTLLLSDLSESKKINVWNTSALKIEMMDFFPDFLAMSELVEERVIDDGDFKQKLLKKIETTEEKYIGGVITGQSAKATLSSF